MDTLGATIEELYKLFHAANGHFYAGRLPTPQLTIQSHGTRKSVFGWCTTYKAWVGAEERYEINIAAEFLNRPVVELAGTVLHEMVHLYNLANDIQDVCGGRYHNKKFKLEAERIGLVVTAAYGYGFAFTTVGPETEAWILAQGLDENAFAMARVAPVRKSRPRKPRTPKTVDPIAAAGLTTYKCGCTVVHCEGELDASCQKCGEPFATLDMKAEPKEEPTAASAPVEPPNTGKRCCECRKGDHPNYDNDVRLCFVRDPQTKKMQLRGYLCSEHREAALTDGYDVQLLEKGA